jgi:hypothetical protein
MNDLWPAVASITLLIMIIAHQPGDPRDKLSSIAALIFVVLR